MKILTVLGARPQFIKAAALSRAVRSFPDITERIVHTGQHFDANMSNVFFDELDIPKPDFQLQVNNLGHGAMTGQMLEKLEEIFLKERPDWVLVYGDTNSTLAGALAAKKLHFRVAHIEAGLRSFNMRMPEEINRIITDRISDYLFCPTDQAIANLKLEGFDHFDCKIARVGDVMFDAAMFYKDKAVRLSFDIPQEFCLATIHRAENTDDENHIRSIVRALETINVQMPVICPLHPRTRKKIALLGLNPSFMVIDPLGYLEMLSLLIHCKIVMTDSGGLQKEAYFFKKPCLTLRDETEWVELVNAGVNRIVGWEYDKIIESFTESITQTFDFSQQLYGNGDASEQILNLLRDR